MAVAQNDRNLRITQKAFEVVGDVTDGYGFYTVKEVTRTIAARRVGFQSSDESTILKPILGRIDQFGGARPFIGHAGRFERSKERANCDEAFTRYGGVLIKECFGGARPFIGQADRLERSNERAINCDEAFNLYGGVLKKEFRY